MKRWLAVLLVAPALAHAADALETRAMFYVEKPFASGGRAFPTQFGFKFMHGPQAEMQRDALMPRRSAILEWKLSEKSDPLRLNGVVLRQNSVGGGGIGAAGAVVALGVVAVAGVALSNHAEDDTNKESEQIAAFLQCVFGAIAGACGQPQPQKRSGFNRVRSAGR
jgi:hypothetical protein